MMSEKGMKLTAIREVTSEIVVEWGENEIEMTVYPGKLTARMIADFDSANLSTRASAVRQVVKRWAILDDDGAEMPVSDELVEQLPHKLLARIAVKAMVATRAEGKASADA